MLLNKKENRNRPLGVISVWSELLGWIKQLP